MARRRRKLPADTETEVLIRSRRRCTLCYGLKGDFEEKIGQIAHVDQNRENDSLDNLAWLCFEHHSLYDSSTSQHKNYQSTEVKHYRDTLYAAIATSAISGPESIGRYTATQATANVIRLLDRIVVIFDWPLRCTPTLDIHPISLAVGKNIDIEQWSTRGFQLVFREKIDVKSFAFFADASPIEYKDEASRQRDDWKAENLNALEIRSPVEGQGGAGGSGNIVGDRGIIIGGRGGAGGVSGIGGAGGSGKIHGDDATIIGGDGGNAGTADGRGGRGARGPTECLGFPSEHWGYGRGGSGANAPEYDRRLNLLTEIREEYMAKFPDGLRYIQAGVDQVPVDWVNQRLSERGEKWRVVSVAEGGYQMPPLQTDAP